MSAATAQSKIRLRGPRAIVWRRLTLARQYTIAALAVSIISIVTFGTLISRQIEASVVDSSAAAATAYLGHFIAPHLQELVSGRGLSAQSVDALDRIAESPAVKKRIAFIKIWHEDGRLVYSTDKRLIGTRYVSEPTLERAWGGFVSAKYHRREPDESVPWARAGVPLLEVSAPVHAERTGEVIAVARFYESAALIDGPLARAKWQSWLITALVALAVIGALFSIVADGSRTIETQRAALTQRISELSTLLHQNKILRDRLERAARQATEDNERFLRQIGSELHDGPAQLVGLSLLHLDSFRSTRSEADAALIRSTLADALDEIRNICVGLLLPEAQNRNLKEALASIIRGHERRTRTRVFFESGDLPANPPSYIKLCLCRFVQEGLTNAFRHAAGKGQVVSAWSDDRSVCVVVSDSGPGMPANDTPREGLRLGLAGLRGRVESIGGTMTVSSDPQKGTRLTARLPVTSGGADG